MAVYPGGTSSASNADQKKTNASTDEGAHNSAPEIVLVALIPKAWPEVLPAPPDAKSHVHAIAFALAHFANDGTEARPTLSELADVAGVSERRLRDCVRQIETEEAWRGILDVIEPPTTNRPRLWRVTRDLSAGAFYVLPLAALKCRPRTLRVVCAILKHMNRRGEARPGSKRLASETGIDRADVLRVIRELATSDFIAVIRSERKPRLRFKLLGRNVTPDVSPYADPGRIALPTPDVSPYLTPDVSPSPSRTRPYEQDQGNETNARDAAAPPAGSPEPEERTDGEHGQPTAQASRSLRVVGSVDLSSSSAACSTKHRSNGKLVPLSVPKDPWLNRPKRGTPEYPSWLAEQEEVARGPRPPDGTAEGDAWKCAVGSVNLDRRLADYEAGQAARQAQA